MSASARRLVEVAAAERGELVEEAVECPSGGLLELREPVELVKRPRVTVLEDDLRARHPVGQLTVDEMADDIVGAPGLASLVGGDPCVGQAPEHGVERRRRSRQDVNRLLEHKRAARTIGFHSHAVDLGRFNVAGI